VATRVLIGEEHALFRAGLARLLADAGLDVVGEAADAGDLVRKAAAHRPDLVITGVGMPPTHSDDGLRAAQEIRARLPATGVLVLSDSVHERAATELISDDGAGVGYLLTQRVAGLDALLDAIRRVAAGGTVLDPEVVRSLLDRGRRDPLAELTAREREVLALLAGGRSNLGIADALYITEHAVEKHVTSVLRKLDITGGPGEHRRVLAALAYLTHGDANSNPPHQQDRYHPPRRTPPRRVEIAATSPEAAPAHAHHTR
jgi:DNA-binding NarL/FixJ family response regulator